MATSLTASYNLSRDQIIRAAFESIGVAVTNEPLDPDDVEVAQVALNALAMSWKSYGLTLWKRGQASITPLVLGQASYSLAPTLGTGTEKPVKMVDVTYKNTATGNETPMTRLSFAEYDRLPNKAQQGTPVQFYFEPQRTGSIMKIWPTADANAVSNLTIEYTYQQPIQDMTSGTEDVDFPNEWYRALILNLAIDLAPKFGLERDERVLLQTQAEDALQLALNFDVEDASLYIQADRY